MGALSALKLNAHLDLSSGPSRETSYHLPQVALRLLGETVVVSLSCAQLLRRHGLCTPPGFSVRGISQARMLEWVAISLDF